MANDFGTSLPFKSPAHTIKLVIFLILSILLMALDHRGTHLQQIREALSVLVYPIQLTAEIPSKIGDWVNRSMAGDKALQVRLGELEAERPLLLAKLQKLDALEAENRRLRALLNSAERVADRAVVAELLQVHPDPYTRKIVISKGSADGAFVGQPVIDSYGIMGQVTELGRYTSTVTLITDVSHAIPVQVNRNGLRTIIVGTGAKGTLDVPFLTSSADIQNGDLLVTSGMGGRFPPGYPVAEVTKIVSDPNDGFLQISATPKAQLDHNKEVLLIWPGVRKPPEEVKR